VPSVFLVEGEEQSPQVRVARAVRRVQLDRTAKGDQGIIVSLGLLFFVKLILP